MASVEIDPLLVVYLMLAAVALLIVCGACAMVVTALSGGN